MRTVVWEQQLDGILVQDSILIALISVRDELVSLCSQILPDVHAASRLEPEDRALLRAADEPGLLLHRIHAAHKIKGRHDTSSHEYRGKTFRKYWLRFTRADAG